MMKRSLLGALAVLTAGATLTGAAAQAQNASPEAELVNLALGRSYTLETPYPADSQFGRTESAHPDDTGLQLTDGVYGGTAFSNSAYVGRIWQGSRIVTIDLGEPGTVERIGVHVLQDNASGIFAPSKIAYYVSLDGEKWERLQDGVSRLPTTEAGPVTQTICIQGIDKQARYVKAEIPVTSWVFMDEIEVLGTRDLSGKKPHPTPDHSRKDDGYPKAGSKQAAGISNQVLLYTGEWQYEPADWISYTKEDLKPYVSYVDAEMNRVDYMFDGFLFLQYATLLNGANYGASGKPTNKADWEKSLDRLFRADYDLGALDQAVAEAKQELKQKGKKYEAKVVLSIPYPRPDQSDFGDVDGDGVSENLNAAEVGEDKALENRAKVVKWYVDEAYARWKDAGYENITLSAFYWFNEFLSRQTSESEDDLIRLVSDYVHGKGAKLQWIPYYFARGWSDWNEVGFDTALMQPNYLFQNTTAERLDTIAQAAYDHGMGVEMEMSDGVLTDPALRDKYYAYLNKGAEHGYMNSFKAFYQQVKTIKKAAESTDPAAREVYDKTYRYLKGVYQP
ncbi:DUF4855 domain-containing protein [Cohnella thailandensis]|uniref:DUF4855 domain-containing protein n=1 Tax=Cohnella thailandensis TaxID=557557 RepID=A0A841SXB8_9BACL|nr:DUF4855 domain-containing protein [Cohnella thailandensis]MBB6634818.1 DUF4855 domain-containing protein [Cohnella thailandensis]MBP1975961.1 hypothetical protein [Cohnella thailandensis]